MNVYIELTEQFNQGRLRAVICSGQAVVLHRLAIMSKDGDWILREEEEALEHVLSVLEARGARYRYGAPLDKQWLSGGWSAHFEFRHQRLRIRTDFFTRPPRIAPAELARIWKEQEGREVPFIDLGDLAEMKKTNRERDYAVIGELARRMGSLEEQLLYSRSARDLIRLSADEPELVTKLTDRRPLLGSIAKGREALEVALDAERRALIHANEARLQAYQDASKDWYQLWPDVAAVCAELPLRAAHAVVLERAENVLPRHPSVGE